MPLSLRAGKTACGIHNAKNASAALKIVVEGARFQTEFRTHAPGDPGRQYRGGLFRSPYHLLLVLIKNIGFSFTFNHGLIDNHLGDVIQ